jgi:hypothetical protein
LVSDESFVQNGGQSRLARPERAGAGMEKNDYVVLFLIALAFTYRSFGLLVSFARGR